MTQLANFNYPPPKNWQDFETLCRDLWREIWKDRNTRKNGRSGQEQQGVDVYGQPNRGQEWAGVQCKGKDNTYETKTVTESELLKEVEKAKSFEPPLSEWVLATTGPRDAQIEKKVRKINSEHQKKDLFSVHIWFWEDIVEELVKYPELMGLHLPQINPGNSLQIIKKIDLAEAGIQSLVSNSAQQTISQEATLLAIADVSKKVDTIQQIRTQDILTPYFNADIDHIRDQIREFHYDDAIKALENLKTRIWSDAPDLIKFRILSNLGSAFYGLGKLEDAGFYFREAHPYNPENEISLTNLALAYSFQSDDENTRLYAQKALEKDPSNTNAFSILLQTVPCKNSLELCLALVPENLRDAGDIAFCIGLAAQTENKFSDALYWFEKAVAGEPENPIFKGNLGAMLMQSLGRETSALLYGQSSEKEKEILNWAIQVLTEALDKTENTDLQKSSLTWLVNRGIAKKLLGNINEAYQDIKQAYDANPDDPQFIKHYALITLRTKNFLDAGDLLEKIKINPDLPEVNITFADFYNSNDKPDKAIEVIDEFLSWNTDSKLEFLARRISIDAYIQMKEPEKAQALVNKLIEDFPSEPATFLEAAKVSYESKIESEAVDYLKTSKELITDETPVAQVIELGDAFFGLKMYRDAVDCYEKIADPEQDSIFTYKLVNAYYYAGILSKTLSICRHMRDQYGIISHYSKIEIWTLEEINDLPQEAELAKKYLIEFPEDLRVKIKLAQVSYLLEAFITTDEIINEDFDVDKLPLDIGITISSLLASRNNLQKSFHLMYELRRRHFDQAEIHSFYQANFFLNKSDDLDWLLSDVVDVDTAVCVEGVDGKKRWFVIEDRENSDLAKNEFTINHPLIIEMLGKKVGDEIPLKSTAQNLEVGKIVEIKNKFVYASHETAEIYESNFPERTDFRSIHIGEPDAGEEHTVHEKVREMIAGNSRHSREGLSLYAQEPFTIGMIGKFLGLDGLEIWHRLLKESDINIFTSSGDINFLQDTVRLLTERESLNIVADITSLNLMYELNVGDEIAAHFGKIIVAPSTIISLSRIIQEKERNLATGYLTVLEINGQLYKNEVTPEQVKDTVKYLKDFQSWIKNNTEVSPYLSGFDIEREQKSKMRETFLPEFYDSIMTVKNEEYLLFTEDGRLRQFAQMQFGVQGVWMQPVLKALKSKEIISLEKYNTALVKLILSNLQFVNLDAFSLIEVAKTVDWTVNDYYKRAINRLRGPESEFISSLKVATVFLLLLAKENKDPRTEESLVIPLLESITEGRNLEITLHSLRLLISRKFILLPFGKKRMLRIIKIWERAQIAKSRGLILPLE